MVYGALQYRKNRSIMLVKTTDMRGVSNKGCRPLRPLACSGRVAVWGGRNGWFKYNILCKIRGAMDKAVGSYGLTRGRRSSDELGVGDTLDLWIVIMIWPLRLLQGMGRWMNKVPGTVCPRNLAVMLPSFGTNYLIHIKTPCLFLVTELIKRLFVVGDIQ